MARQSYLRLPDHLLMMILQYLPLFKLRQLKSVGREWCHACRQVLTSTQWLVKGKSDKEVRQLLDRSRDEDDECTGPPSYVAIGISFAQPLGDDWTRVSQMASLIYHHTFTLPFHAMTWPGGVCFSDGFGGLDFRVITIHDLVIKDGRILSMIVETKDGIFSTLRDIFEHVILCRALIEYLDDGTVEEARKEYYFDGKCDELILRNLLPCVKVGNAYISGHDGLEEGAVTMMHIVNPLYDGPSNADKSTTCVRTRFLLRTRRKRLLHDTCSA